MKKAIKIICIILFISIMLVGYIWDNLISNSVYYAKNMPKDEGQHPEWIMLIDNMEDIYKPEIEGIEYKIDGINFIIDRKNNEVNFGNIYLDEIRYIYSDEKQTDYRFNKNMELLNAIDDKYNKVDIKSINKDEIISKIDTLLKPVVEAQPKPTINLQWLFNMIHKDEFK